MTTVNMVSLPLDNRLQGAGNVSDTRPDYDRVTFDVPLGMRDEIKRLVKAKTGLSLASYLKQLIAQDLGVQIDMKPQVANNTGKRKKS